MNKSDSIANICAALIKFQSKVEPAQKDSENPHFKSRFASLASIIDTCRELLAECELAFTQVNQPTEPGLIAMETMLMHTSGEWVSGTIVLPMTKLDPQQAGSANTYARRYGLAAILGIVQEDDDAETHRKEAGKSAPKQPKPLTREQEIHNMRLDISSLVMELKAIRYDRFDVPERRTESYQHHLGTDNPNECTDANLLYAYLEHLRELKAKAVSDAIKTKMADKPKQPEAV